MQHHHSPNRTVHRHLLITVLALAFLAGACGNGDSPTAGIDPVAPPSATTDPNEDPTPPPTDGYVDPVAPPATTDPNEDPTTATTGRSHPSPHATTGRSPPQPPRHHRRMTMEDGSVASPSGRPSTSPSTSRPTATRWPTRGTEAMAAAPALAESEAMPEAPPEADRAIEVDDNGDSTGLTGGSIDDNERFEEYLAYRERFGQLGIPSAISTPAGESGSS